MTHNKAPWGEDLAPLLKAGTPLPSSISQDCRVLAESNFQFAKHRVNCHEALLKAAKVALNALEIYDFDNSRQMAAPQLLRKAIIQAKEPRS